MRIIGGLHRGRKIKSVKGTETRPTTDFVREALFNIIGINVVKSCFLDIFAGTGAVGLEALSRGADNAVFIEKNAKACSVIKQNIKDLDFSDKALVMQDDVLSALKKLDSKGYIFDIIFMDPPYYKNQIGICLEFLRGFKIAKSIVIIQHPKDESFKHEGFMLYKYKKYGISALTFLKKE